MKASIQAAITIAAITLGTAAHATPERDLAHAKNLLLAKEPEEVRLEDGVLTAIFEDRISGEDYLSTLRHLCFGLITGKTLDSVTQIEILDNGGETGFIYGKGLDDCQTFLDRETDDDRTRAEILEATQVK